MAYRLNLHIESVENGQFVAVSSDIPGLWLHRAGLFVRQ